MLASGPRPSIVEIRRRDAPRRTISKGSRFHFEEAELLALQEQRRRDLEDLAEILTEHGNGSLLRGWRCELDPVGILEVDFQEMCKVAKRLAWSGDLQSLFGEDNCFGSLGIEDVAPQQGQLLRRFKAWVKEVFQTPAQMFEAFAPSDAGAVTRETFFESCRAHGFPASDQELGDIFDCCDWGETGSIVEEDVIFLEADRETRDLEVFKAQTLNMREWRHQIAQEYLEQSRKPAMDAPQQRHRLAPRPWQAKTFEQLPTIACQQRNDRRRSTRQREQQAKEAFLHHLREIYGSEVRALRRSLDSDGSFGFSQLNLRYYCRKVDLDINPKDLWRALDRDGDGSVGLPELCVKPSMALARFQRWAINSTFSSCADIWDTPEAVAARARTRRGSWGSEKKMLFASFAEALRDLDWPQIHDHHERSLVFSSLDSYGCGLIMRSDLEWLDKWKPPEWLHAEPDPEAWSNLKGLLIRIYRYPIHAWRRLLDRDSCGKVSWEDFKAACSKLRFRARVAGCWRAIDTDLVGFITLSEYDPQSAMLLGSFKDWAENTYGSVEQCFRQLEDAGGLVCYSDLKRACHKTKWVGDVRAVFESMEAETRKTNSLGQRAVCFADAAFLDVWDFAPQDDDPQSKVEEVSAEAQWPRYTLLASPFERYESRGTIQRTSTETTLTRLPTSESATLFLPSPQPSNSPTASPTVPRTRSTSTSSTLPRTPSTPARGSRGGASVESTESGLETSPKRLFETSSPKLFPLIPTSRQHRSPGFQKMFQLGSPDKKKVVKSLARSITVPGTLDALRTNTYPRQPRSPSLAEAPFDEDYRSGAYVDWTEDGLFHWPRLRPDSPQNARMPTPGVA